MDSGSQMSLITNEFFKKLKISSFKNKVNIVGISKNVTEVTNSVYVEISSCFYDYKKNVKCSIVERISSLPKLECDYFNMPVNIVLSANDFDKSGDIDILLSADIFFEVLLEDKQKLDSGIFLQNTLFGYIVGGLASTNTTYQNFFISLSLQNSYKNEMTSKT